MPSGHCILFSMLSEKWQNKVSCFIRELLINFCDYIEHNMVSEVLGKKGKEKKHTVETIRYILRQNGST